MASGVTGWPIARTRCRRRDLECYVAVASGFWYPGTGERGAMVMRGSGRGAGPPTLRQADVAMGSPPSMPSGVAAGAAGAALRVLVAGTAAAAGLMPAADVAQIGGTDNAPREPARPTPADTAAPPAAPAPGPAKPVDPSTLVADSRALASLPTAWVVGARVLIVELREDIPDRPELTMETG